MKKISIILLVLITVSCSKLTTLSTDFIQISFPSNWTFGRINPSSELVKIEVIGNTKESIESIANEYQNTLADSSISFAQDGIVIEGYTEDAPNAAFVSVENITITNRDLDIERERLTQTDTTLNDPVIINELTKINMTQIALILAGAYADGINVEMSEIEKEANAVYLEAKNQGLSKVDFLSSWGITEEELHIQILQKLYYTKVLRKLRLSNADIDESELATKHLEDLINRFEIKEYSKKQVAVRIKIIQKSNRFVVSSIFSDSNVITETAIDIVDSVKTNDDVNPNYAVYFVSAPSQNK